MKKLINTPVWVVLLAPWVVVVAFLFSMAGGDDYDDHVAHGHFDGHAADHGVGSSHQDKLRNPVDVGFAQSMLLHHAQAVQMSRIVQGKLDGEVGELATAIALKQNYEQGLMTGWLSAWGQATTVIGPPMRWVEEVTEFKTTDDALYAAQCRAANGAMPGLATQAQLDALSKAKGDAKARIFLQLMMAHHEAAIPMARFALNHGRSSMVRNFALSVMKEQQTEIDWMKQKLAAFAK